MSSELAAFKEALNSAGQPWSRWGVRLAGAGIVALLIVQIASRYVPFALAELALVLIVAGWILLVVAYVKRSRWAKAHPLEEPQSPIAP